MKITPVRMICTIPFTALKYFQSRLKVSVKGKEYDQENV